MRGETLTYLLRLQLLEPQNCLDELGIAFALVRNRRLEGLELIVALNQLLRSYTGVIIGFVEELDRPSLRFGVIVTSCCFPP